jgi:hypothetical protein
VCGRVVLAAGGRCGRERQPRRPRNFRPHSVPVGSHELLASTLSCERTYASLVFVVSVLGLGRLERQLAVGDGVPLAVLGQ